MPKAAPATERLTPSRREWSREVEAASIELPHPDLAKAIDRFRALKDPAFGNMLAREIAETRAAELTLAYRNVVMVASGFKVSCTAAGIERVNRTPCVVFVVRRKLTRKAAAAEPHQHLPEYLLTHAEHGGRREMFAVPTDVQPETWFCGARTRGASCVDVLDPEKPARGTLTCAVDLPGSKGPKRMILSALHVLNPFPLPNLSVPVGELLVLQSGSEREVAQSSAFGGTIRSDGGISFDAQLAAIDDPDVATEMLAHLKLSRTDPFVAGPASFAELSSKPVQLVVPANHPDANGSRAPIRLKFRTTLGQALALSYRVRSGSGTIGANVRHREVLQFEVLDGRVPLSGDSGSPVLATLPDGKRTLVGMFIASPDSGRFAFVIPAWELADVVNWKSLPAGTTSVEAVQI